MLRIFSFFFYQFCSPLPCYETINLYTTRLYEYFFFSWKMYGRLIMFVLNTRTIVLKVVFILSPNTVFETFNYWNLFLHNVWSFRWNGSSQGRDSWNEDWRRENTGCYFASLFECINWKRSSCGHCQWLSGTERLWMGWSSTPVSWIEGWPNPTYGSFFCYLLSYHPFSDGF